MIRTRLSLWALALLGSACGSVPEIRYYTLAAPGDGSAPAAVSAEGLTIGVEIFDVDPPYDQGSLVYRLGPDSVEVGFYDYHRWASSLGRLAALAVAEGLRGVPGVAVCELATGSYSATLTGRVVYLEEVDLKDGQLARIKIELRLEDAGGGRLWAHTLASETKLRAGDASEIVERLRADLRGLIEDAAGELDKALSRPPAPATEP